MTLLHSLASMFEPTPRIAATGALACTAGSWLSDALGAYRPDPRGNFIA